MMKCVVKAKRRLANGIDRLQIEAAGEERAGGCGCRIGMDVVVRLATSIDIGTHLLVERDAADDEARRAKMSARYTTIAASTASTASSTASTSSTSRPMRNVFASAGGLLLRIAAEEGSSSLASSLREGTTFTLSLFDAS